VEVGMIRPELRRIAAQVRARLQSGEALTWRDVWAMAPDASRTWAHDALRKLYANGEIHIVAWTRSQQGPPMPTYGWGHGMDARRPANMTNAEKCERWRTAHPERVAIARKRTTAAAPSSIPSPPPCSATPDAAPDGSNTRTGICNGLRQ
jgi:hypothetical protein